jgi:hypothetical protein
LELDLPKFFHFFIHEGISKGTAGTDSGVWLAKFSSFHLNLELSSSLLDSW